MASTVVNVTLTIMVYNMAMVTEIDISELYSRPIAMGWHEVANATPRQQDASLFSTPGNFFIIFIVAISL